MTLPYWPITPVFPPGKAVGGPIAGSGDGDGDGDGARKAGRVRETGRARKAAVPPIARTGNGAHSG